MVPSGAEVADLTLSERSRSGDRLLEAAILAVALPAYSNGLTALGERKGLPAAQLFALLNPFLAIALIAYAARRPGGLGGVGLSKKGWWRSGLWGLGAGSVLSLPALIFFRGALMLDTPLEYGPVAGMSGPRLLADLLLDKPLNVALLEEIAFRGLLYSALRSRLPAAPALTIQACVFAAWHFKVTADSAGQSNLAESVRLPRPMQAHVSKLAVAGGVLSTGVAGVAFGLLRERTGHLAGSISAHWLVDVLMILALWRQARSGLSAATLAGPVGGVLGAGDDEAL